MEQWGRFRSLAYSEESLDLTTSEGPLIRFWVGVAGASVCRRTGSDAVRNTDYSTSRREDLQTWLV